MLALFIFIAAVILLAGSFYAYTIAYHSPISKRDQVLKPLDPQYDPYREEMLKIHQRLRDRPCEFVSIPSKDGLLLSGRYYHIQDGAPLDIGFHGYRSNPLVDFSGGTELSFQLGHNVLLVDQRAQGRSEGRTITFGILERQDLLCWLDYAIDRFGEDLKILLYGVSMGGATVLMASELALPVNVKGIIADCPYAKPLDVILHVGRKTPIPQSFIKPLAILGARIFGGFDLLETDAVRAVQRTGIPILIFHGEDDRYVPCEMSAEISYANPAMVRRFTFPEAAHGISYLVDTPRYQKLVKEFIGAIM